MRFRTTCRSNSQVAPLFVDLKMVRFARACSLKGVEKRSRSLSGTRRVEPSVPPPAYLPAKAKGAVVGGVLRMQKTHLFLSHLYI